MKLVRRTLTVLALAAFLSGLGAAPASAGREVCPWVKMGGNTYQICFPLP